MSEETLLEVVDRRDRSSVAATLRTLAEQLEDEEEVTVAGDGDAVTVSPPEDLGFKLEVEQSGEDAFEVEVELRWDDDDAGADVGSSKGRFELYEDTADEWRWRLVHRNGNVIADSGEGYTTRANAENGIRSVMTNAPGARIERVD